MTELSDQAWADICNAAGRTPRHEPDLPNDADAEARAVLSYILFELYPGLAYHRECVAATRKRTERMLKNLEEFEADYRSQFPNSHFPNAADAARNLRTIEQIRLDLRIVAIGAHGERGRKSFQRELLYQELCWVWLNHFDGKLTYSVPPAGGPPRGPLISFIIAAFRQVVLEDSPPSPETVRDNIDRVRAFYAKAGSVKEILAKTET